jgi:hypothetical protein
MIFSRSASKNIGKPNNLNKWPTTHIHINVHQSHNIVKTNNLQKEKKTLKKNKKNHTKRKKHREQQKNTGNNKKKKKEHKNKNKKKEEGKTMQRDNSGYPQFDVTQYYLYLLNMKKYSVCTL